MYGLTMTTEEAKDIDLVMLRQWGYLEAGVRSGTLRWLRGDRETGRVAITTNIEETSGHLELLYTYHRSDTADPEKIHYRAALVATSCHLGGQRWWVLCPASGCGKRVRTLFCSNKYFFCRKCCGLWYESQKYMNQEFREIGNIWKADKYLRTLKRRTYRGKPTRKFRRYLKLRGTRSLREVADLEASLFRR